MSPRLRRLVPVSITFALSFVCLQLGVARAQDMPPQAPLDAPPAAPPDVPPPPPPPPMAPPPPSFAPAPVPPTSNPPPAPSTAIVTAAPPLKVEAPSTTFRFGLLAQPQYEAIGNQTRDSMTQNLYLRRIRLLFGGTLFKSIEYFVETDSPNLFKGAAGATDPMTGAATFTKTSALLTIQDAFFTWKPLVDMDMPKMGDYFKIDAGYMLPPLSHNAVQGATTLYGWDYFANTFLSSDVFGNAPPSPVGRDLGVQARGLVVDGHVEYRVGMFQGLRNNQTMADVGGRNFFRVAARLQINLLDPEPGFFYAGTYLGAKKIASIGGSYDFQDDYKYWDVDGILDMPVGPGVVTGQVNFAQWNASSGTFINLAKQSAIMGEAGYTFAGFKVSPIFRYERHWFSAAGATESRYVPGIAWWPFGHNSNLKFFYSRVQVENAAHGYNRFNLQWQVYFY
jgi:hypothetical protein